MSRAATFALSLLTLGLVAAGAPQQPAPAPGPETESERLAARGEWDEALRQAEAEVAREGFSLAGVRSRRLLARLFLDAPHLGFRSGGVLRRGSEHREGEQVWLDQEDRDAAQKALEAARTILARYERGELRAEKRSVLREIVATDLDLADLLQARWSYRDWPAFVKADDLYLEAIRFADQIHDDRSAGIAVYARALVRHRRRAPILELRKADRPLTPDEKEALARLGEPPAELRSMGERYPGHPLADDALYVAGRLLEERGEFKRAEAVYEEVEGRYPKSPWVSDSRGALQHLRAKDLAFVLPNPILPDQPASLSVRSRNVGRVAFAAYRLDPEKALLDPARGARPPAFPATEPLLALVRGAQPVATWSFESGDQGLRVPLSGAATMPALPRGVYLFEAKAEGITTALLALVTDLALVQKNASDGILFYAAHAVTGAPVAGARVVLHEWSGDPNKPGVVRQGETGPDGLVSLARSRDDQGSRQIEALAIRGDAVAITSPSWFGWWYGRTASVRVHLTTDRPAYRPGQSVHFRGVALRPGPQGETPASRARASVLVRDPRGNEVFSGEFVTDGYGAFSGSLVLGAEPPLGEYPIELKLDGEPNLEAAGNVFRVEEYRKPEFEVGVDAGAALRSGEPGRASVSARYYFGSPVVDATVSWSVRKRLGSRPAPFRDPAAAFLSHVERGPWGGWAAPQDVAHGEARTDASGQARIEWPTQAGEDARYEIEARVVDLSRREVRGSGVVRASRATFDLFVRPDRGFYRPGERIGLEVVALDANDRPVAANVTLAAFRRTWSALREKLDEERVEETTLTLDAQGRGTWRTALPAAGEYRLAATAIDDRQEKIAAEAIVRVADEDTASSLFRLSNLEMSVERTAYDEGQTGRVLLASSKPGAVLFTAEAGGEILLRRVVRLEGKSRLVELRFERGFAPNVFLRALQIGDGQVFAVEREIAVPPQPRLLRVTATPAASTVKPGQQGEVRLRVTDAEGRPVVAALSLAVTDRAVEAIQSPYAPDIGMFFYGRPRQRQIQETSSFQFTAYLSQVLDVKPQPYKRHGEPLGWWGSFRANKDWALVDDLSLDAKAEQGGIAARAMVASPAAANELVMVSGDASSAEPQEGKLRKEARQDAFAEATTRSNFADTAYWNANVVTGADGQASVSVPYPDSLTEWRILARGSDGAARVGEASATTVTRKNLMVRLQSPRFFVERDRALLSALVRNDLPQAIEALVKIRVSDALQLDAPAETRIRVEAGADARFEWPVRVTHSGEAKIYVAALAKEESDAAEQSFEALIHGVDKQVSRAGRLRAGETTELAFEIPAERGAGTARLELRVAPTLLSSLIEAIPYLVDYPYGCVEQTMSRFLPAVVLSRTLAESGVDLADLASRRSRLQVEGRGATKRKDPVFRRDELQAMVAAGLTRLYGFQNSQGGFGWWKEDAGDVRMTAYVLYGLVTARDAGFTVRPETIQNALRFLETSAKDEASLHARSYAAFALATAGAKPDFALLVKRQADLTIHGKALLALALHRAGRKADARLVLSSLEALVHEDRASETASWRIENAWWFWENDRVESQAFGLLAFAEIAPENPLGPKLARWLMLNRQGSRWHSTRDTAHAIYALSAFAKGAGEVAELQAEASFGGITKAFRITPQNAFAFDDTLVLDDATLGSGPRTLKLRTSGSGALYYEATLRYFTKEEDVKGSGTTLRLRREYVRKRDGATLASLASVKSGEEIDVKLTIEAPTAYDHLVFEDPKPAGFEPVALKSGSVYGDGLCSNMELRDEKVAFFITHLAQGTQVIRYTLRAETPGSYHALPARGHAMYAPEIAALADEWRGSVEP